MKKLNQIWRIFATGFCFVSFGIGCLILSILVFPVLWMMPISPSKKKAISQTIIHKTFQFFAALMQFVGVLRLSIKGAERLVEPRGYFIVANHPTLIDVVLLMSLIPRTDCIVKQALWNNFFFMGVVSSAGYISNSGDPEQLIEDCAACLKKGSSLLVFPEGTRTQPGKTRKFQRGAANIALRARKNITPITIICEPPTLTKSEKWYNVPPDRLVHITLKVGEDIPIDSYLEFDHASLGARKLTKSLQNYFQKEATANE